MAAFFVLKMCDKNNLLSSWTKWKILHGWSLCTLSFLSFAGLAPLVSYFFFSS